MNRIRTPPLRPKRTTSSKRIERPTSDRSSGSSRRIRPPEVPEVPFFVHARSVPSPAWRERPKTGPSCVVGVSVCLVLLLFSCTRSFEASGEGERRMEKKPVLSRRVVAANVAYVKQDKQTDRRTDWAYIDDSFPSQGPLALSLVPRPDRRTHGVNMDWSEARTSSSLLSFHQSGASSPANQSINQSIILLPIHHHWRSQLTHRPS